MDELRKSIEEYHPFDEKEKVDKEVMLEFLNNNKNCLKK